MMKKIFLITCLLIVSLLVSASPFGIKVEEINKDKPIAADQVVATNDGKLINNSVIETPIDGNNIDKSKRKDSASMVGGNNNGDKPNANVGETSPKEAKISRAKINEGKRTIEENDRRDESKGLFPILFIVALIMALLGSLFLCFQLWRKNQVLEEEKNKTIKELSPIAPAYARKSIHELARAISKKYNDMAHDLEAMKRDQNGLKEKIEILEEKNRFSQNSVLDGGSRYNDVKSYETGNEDSGSPTILWDIEKENAERLHHDPEVIPEVVSLVGKEMFLYLPNDNMFKEGTEEYRSGKTLYKMTYTSNETADFEFVNRPEALAFAKQSRSRFLESACVIENDDAISFNTIQTLEKGKLTKADEGWNIISKARIRLS